MGTYPPKSCARHSAAQSSSAKPLSPRGLLGAGVRNMGRAPPTRRSSRCVMPGDSVWLCSTHPKPSPTTFQGWLAPIWPPGPELLNTSGMSNLELACRNAHLVRLLDLWSAPGRTRAVGPGPMSGTQRWGFSGTAPMPRACGRPAQRLSPQPFRVAPGRHAHGGCTATFRTWPGT